MSQPDSLDVFITWTQDQNVQVDGVRPQSFPGRGVGIAATQDIKAGTEIIHVPFNALLHPENSIPRSFRERFKPQPSSNGTTRRTTRPKPNSKPGRRDDRSSITTHGLIAAFLTYGDISPSRYSAWKATWPTYEDFQTTMPFLWSASLMETRCKVCRKVADEKCGHASGFVEMLPLEICSGGNSHSQDDEIANISRGKFHTMRLKILKDWQAVTYTGLAKSSHFNQPTLSDLDKLEQTIDLEYIYNWCITNTRSFYFLHSTSPPPPPSRSDDAMLLCPFIDLFNHTSPQSRPPSISESESESEKKEEKDHCTVSFTDTGFTVTTNRAYIANEELLVSYGAHNNDFLLAEYGFLLSQNGHDTVNLDEVILNDLSTTQKRTLDERGYLGNYSVQFISQDPRGDVEVCWRTQVAAHLFVLSEDEWADFVAGSFVDPVTVERERKPLGRKRKGMGDIPNAYWEKTAQEQADEKIKGWLGGMTDRASESLKLLDEMGKEEREVRTVFGGDGAGDGAEKGQVEERARKRYDLVYLRWTEIHAMCLGGVFKIEKEKENRRKELKQFS